MVAGTEKSLATCLRRLEQVARLTRAGVPARRIASRLGVCPETVSLYRRRIREGWEPYRGCRARLVGVGEFGEPEDDEGGGG